VIGLPDKRRIRINKRVTGVSVPPGFGIAWETVPDVEREVLLRLLPFLEDRRVLYDPTEVEIPNRCVESVLRLREFLVDLAGLLKEDAKLREVLRSMSAACRAFLTRLPDPQSQEPLGSPGAGWGYPSWVFNQALGELRGRIGIYLAVLVTEYGIKIELPLAAILPPPPGADE